MRHFAEAALERAMKVQEIILRGMAGKLTWIQAASILRISPRQMRRWLRRYEEWGYDGLYDRRRGKPSPRRVPVETVKAVLRLYQEDYPDFNVRHFCEKLREEHQITLSYTWVKTALQEAGLVRKRSKRGPHRKRRERRPLPGMMLHIDGSKHRWFGDERSYDLIVILDDATSEIYYAQLVEEESTRSVMQGLWEVVSKQGVFCSLYSDRASHFFVTMKAGEMVDENRLTQVGRALKELGIEAIAAYSPQARGRGERSFGTWQGRLPQELRIRNITTIEQANLFLRESYIAEFNAKFAVQPAQSGTAFVRSKRSDLENVFCLKHERLVANDNTIRFGQHKLQLERTLFRATLAGCRVWIHEHLDESLSVWFGQNLIARFDANRQLLNHKPTFKPDRILRQARHATMT